MLHYTYFNSLIVFYFIDENYVISFPLLNISIVYDFTLVQAIFKNKFIE